MAMRWIHSEFSTRVRLVLGIIVPRNRFCSYVEASLGLRWIEIPSFRLAKDNIFELEMCATCVCVIRFS
jgi:hypothetical protein